MTIAMKTAVPVLRMFSIEKADEFYLDFLGFTVDFDHRFAPDAPLYRQVSRDAVCLHLTEHFGDASPGSTAFIRMTGIEDFHAELTAKNYRHARPGLETVPWGKMLTVADPFGNRLRFDEGSR